MCFFIVLSSCSNTNFYVGSSLEAKDYSEKLLSFSRPLELKIDCDSGNIEVYTWEKKEIKFEMTKNLRGEHGKTNFEDEFDNFSTVIGQEENIVFFRSEYDGSIKEFEDRILNLKLFIPQDTRTINCNLENGAIKFQDDLNCNLLLDLNSVRVEINRLNGKINLQGEKGNLTVGGGLLKGGSSMKLGLGNMDIKTALEEGGNYIFETNTGNINLKLPINSLFNLESIGTVYIDEFPSEVSKTNLSVKSGFGEISITKFIDY